jgi:hypothetical protein
VTFTLQKYPSPTQLKTHLWTPCAATTTETPVEAVAMALAVSMVVAMVVAMTVDMAPDVAMAVDMVLALVMAVAMALAAVATDHVATEDAILLVSNHHGNLSFALKRLF